jgi:hypothetical protein
MDLSVIDKTGLMQDSYQIDGILPSECRSIFLDWALKLPDEIDPQAAITYLISHYGKEAPEHPMTLVLRDGQGTMTAKGRRGGRSARVSS